MTDFPHIPFGLEGFDDAERVERGRRFRDWLDRRRSVRFFTDEPVDRGCIEVAIEAASTAPSGAHMQPWTFVAIGDPEIKRELRSKQAAGTLEVVTDFRASPTGYPFKLAQLEGSVTEPDALERRRRVCDLGYLRSFYCAGDDEVGYRCPGEPERAFVAKGGDPSEMAGRLCVCNGLLATVGLGQVRGAERLVILRDREPLGSPHFQRKELLAVFV